MSLAASQVHHTQQSSGAAICTRDTQRKNRVRTTRVRMCLGWRGSTQEIRGGQRFAQRLQRADGDLCESRHMDRPIGILTERDFGTVVL